MSRVLGLSGIKRMEQLKAPIGSKSGAMNAKMLSSPSFVPSVSDSTSSGSVMNLKLAADKIVKEQASAKRDLELANSKLKKLTEQIRILEEKLQNAFNENAKLKAKEKEDVKMWKGLESKFSLTKILCDQLTETLQLLTVQVQDAEKDKAFFEDKLSAASVALDKLHEQMESMSLCLDSSEEKVRTRERELMELGLVKETTEASLRDEQNRAARVIKEKDGTIKQLEETVAANRMALESLSSKMDKLHLEMRVKEDNLLDMRKSKEIMERENLDLFSSKNDFCNKLEMALKEITKLEDVINILLVKFTELENQSLTFSEKFIQLNAAFDLCHKLAQLEKELYAQRTQKKIDQIDNQCISIASERNFLQLRNQELDDKVLELQKEQELTMVQHADECRLAEERIWKLETEAETLLAKQKELQTLIAMLEDNAKTSLENLRLSDKKMQDLLLKHSELENESKGLTDELKTYILKRQDEIDILKTEIEKNKDIIESLEKKVSELENALEEKDKHILELQTTGKQFEDQKTEITKLLADKESKLEEAKKQYDQILESKQLELSKHLKEISQRNDQAINDLRKKYEAEKQESVNLEKEKANKAVQESENKYEQTIEDYKEEFRQYLVRTQEEHGKMLHCIQQDHDEKEMSLISKHKEEMKRLELQAENELREKSTSLRSEHEAKLRALRCEHEDECKRLQGELDIQKAKEERQRALLQLQWKVMGDNQQEDQEVNSKKNYISSSTLRNSGGGKINQHALGRTEVEVKETPYLKATQMPVSNVVKKDIPKHGRKVTHHEYEIETSDGGRTVTKRKKTKSTIMFEDPRKQRKRETPKAKRETPRAKPPKDVIQGVKSRGHQNRPNIGDLFSEGSLNPYADDPYTFD